VTGFDVETLIDCYRQGLFPMAETRTDRTIYLIDPEERGVIPLDGFHLPRRLARTVRSGRFEVRIDTAFAQVISECAEPGPGRLETWINAPIEALYGELFRRGLAHCVEVWLGERLVGGLYGVSLGAAFFGESMFSRERDASKVALVHLVARLKAGGYRLLDTQFITPHLTGFGAEEIPRAAYHRRLADALKVEADFGRFPALASAEMVLGAIGAS
jgi:leucyl/phenylalanyl-tRNA--protein transferase